MGFKHLNHNTGEIETALDAEGVRYERVFETLDEAKAAASKHNKPHAARGFDYHFSIIDEDTGEAVFRVVDGEQVSGSESRRPRVERQRDERSSRE